MTQTKESMRVKETTTQNKNGFAVWIDREYLRDHWYEWFYVVVDDGDMRPRFYLPVSRMQSRYAYTCWVFPLAPFILVGLIIRNASWSIWHDLLDFSALLYEKSNRLTNKRHDPN